MRELHEWDNGRWGTRNQRAEVVFRHTWNAIATDVAYGVTGDAISDRFLIHPKWHSNISSFILVDDVTPRDFEDMFSMWFDHQRRLAKWGLVISDSPSAYSTDFRDEVETLRRMWVTLQDALDARLTRDDTVALRESLARRRPYYPRKRRSDG